MKLQNKFIAILALLLIVVSPAFGIERELRNYGSFPLPSGDTLENGNHSPAKLTADPTWINVQSYGAMGDGVADDSAAIRKALAAGKYIVIPAGTYKISSTITLPDADRFIVGIGEPVLTTFGGNTIFYRTSHGVFTNFDGIKFTGNGIAIHFDMNDSETANKEYEIKNCSFIMARGVWGIRLEGAREGYIYNSRFEKGNGIYSSRSNYRIIDKCFFKNGGTAVFDDGVGSPYSTGSYIMNTEIMGYGTGFRISRSDDFLIQGSTIDYNDANIQILGQEGGKIIGNYIGSRTKTPAIEIGPDKERSSHIIIGLNIITGHAKEKDYDAVRAAEADYCQVVNNSIVFWTRYGLDYEGMTHTITSGNHFSPRSGYGAASINIKNDSPSNKIMMNDLADNFTLAGNVRSQLFNNRNYVTENSGTAAVPPEKRSVAVTHSMSYTPAPGDISVTPANNMGKASKFWISDITDRTFTINIDTEPGGAGAYFSWRVMKRIF